jgi:cyclic beta-1,2-glucan synthetase
VFSSPHHVAPRTHLLSNGNYSVMLTAAGSGYSRWRDIAVTRWREDPTCDPWGSYVFLRDVANGQVWSAGYQPVGREPDSYEVAFFEDRAEITRRDGPILTSTEILVSPEDDAEVRRVSVTNEGSRAREIELTTYAEVVLAPADADSAHPAFSKLFVQTEFIAESGALLATRRVREPAEPALWVAHVSALEGGPSAACSSKPTARAFSAAAATCAMPSPSWTRGRCRNTWARFSIPCCRCAAGCASRREKPCASRFGPASAQPRAGHRLIDKHRDMAAFERAKTLAWTQAQVQLRYLGVDFEEAQAISAHRQPGAVLRFLAAGVARHPREEPAGTLRPVAPRHLRRPAHRAGAHRR